VNRERRLKQLSSDLAELKRREAGKRIRAAIEEAKHYVRPSPSRLVLKPYRESSRNPGVQSLTY
jgi:hypothetical protein